MMPPKTDKEIMKEFVPTPEDAKQVIALADAMEADLKMGPPTHVFFNGEQVRDLEGAVIAAYACDNPTGKPLPGLDYLNMETAIPEGYENGGMLSNGQRLLQATVEPHAARPKTRDEMVMDYDRELQARPNFPRAVRRQLVREFRKALAKRGVA